MTYENGRGYTGSEGEIAADFDGEHGWFWRNRDDVDFTVTVQALRIRPVQGRELSAGAAIRAQRGEWQLTALA